MPEKQYRCADCAALESDVMDIQARVRTLEGSHARMKESFVMNDLNLPDYDGHRSAHKGMIEQTKVLEGYKRDATKTIIGWILAAVLGMFSMGFFDWVRAHLK